MGKDHFLDKEDHWKGRKLKEALYINALNPSTTTNASKIMNLEKGFKLGYLFYSYCYEYCGVADYASVIYACQS